MGWLCWERIEPTNHNSLTLRAAAVRHHSVATPSSQNCCQFADTPSQFQIKSMWSEYFDRCRTVANGLAISVEIQPGVVYVLLRYTVHNRESIVPAKCAWLLYPEDVEFNQPASRGLSLGRIGRRRVSTPLSSVPPPWSRPRPRAPSSSPLTRILYVPHEYRG
ncbi:hypothetical protein BD309DRAFT_387438 [Dichomitus squalens]|nr:hypothetical protein BD309DRAFT_387438 [Dichomitus squalens]